MTVVVQDRIRTRSLGNGITLVFEEMPWLRSLSMTFQLPLGAVTDPTGLEGSATVLYDWLGRGAAERDSRSFNDELDGLGVRRAGGAGRETTSFSASMLAATLPEAMPLLADMLRRPRLEAEEFASARVLAQQELASLEDSPALRLAETLANRYFKSAHGRSSYGTREGLEALDDKAAKADYRRRYGPAGMIVAAAGGADWEQLVSLVERWFGDWSGEVPSLPDVAIERPNTHHVEADTSQVQIGFAYPALPPQDEQWYRQSLAMNILSGGTGSRLHTEVREKRGLAYSVHAFTRALRGYGYVIGRAGTTPERADQTLEVMLGEVSRLGAGVEADELERARAGILSQLVMQGESSSARALSLAQDVHLRGQPRSLGQVKAAISSVTLEDVNSFLALQQPPQPTVVTLGPAVKASS